MKRDVNFILHIFVGIILHDSSDTVNFPFGGNW